MIDGWYLSFKLYDSFNNLGNQMPVKSLALHENHFVNIYRPRKTDLETQVVFLMNQ